MQAKLVVLPSPEAAHTQLNRLIVAFLRLWLRWSGFGAEGLFKADRQSCLSCSMCSEPPDSRLSFENCPSWSIGRRSPRTCKNTWWCLELRRSTPGYALPYNMKERGREASCFEKRSLKLCARQRQFLQCMSQAFVMSPCPC